MFVVDSRIFESKEKIKSLREGESNGKRFYCKGCRLKSVLKIILNIYSYMDRSRNEFFSEKKGFVVVFVVQVQVSFQ